MNLEDVLKSLDPREAERSVDELEKGIIDNIAKLSPQARVELTKYTEEYLGGDAATLEALYYIDYEHKVVSPAEFFTHPDYMGHFRGEIFDAWWPHLLKITNPDSGIWEVIMTGSIGMGKSTVTGLICTYHLHRCLCLRDPALFFGLGKKSKIVFGIYALSLETAEEVGFYILRDQMIQDSPFFRDLYPKKNKGNNRIVMPKNISILLGSNALHAAGKNIFWISIDEVNLMKKKKEEGNTSKAHELANAASRRLESRFLQQGGGVPGCVILIGSAASESDFTAQRIRTVKDTPGRYVVRGNAWTFGKPKKLSGYCGKKFRVQIGGEKSDNEILDEVIVPENGKFSIETKIYEVKEPAFDATVEYVPVEHYAAFLTDIEGAIKDIAGISTKSFNKFMADKGRILNCVDKNLPRAFDAEVLSAYLGGDLKLAEAFNRMNMCKVSMGSYVPLRHPWAPRYAHIDLAKNQDFAGIAMCHPTQHDVYIEGKGDEENELGYLNIAKNIEVDFILAIRCGPGKESIDFKNIRGLFYFIKQLGFWLRHITLDSWQSEDSLQRFYDAKIKASILSMDKKSQPYKTLRSALYMGDIDMPEHTLCYNELIDLEYDAHADKIDHPIEGSKDVADGLAGCVYTCLTDKIPPSEFKRSSAFLEQKKDKNYSSYLPNLKDLSSLANSVRR